MWDKKDKICQEPGKLIEPSQAGGNLLGEALLKGSVKGLFNLGRAGAAKAVKSKAAKQKIKEVANKYLDQALDRFTSDLSKKLDPMHSGGALGGNTKAYCGIKKVPKGRHRGDAVDCKNQIRYWGINEVDKKLLDEFIKNKKQKQKMKRQEKKNQDWWCH